MLNIIIDAGYKISIVIFSLIYISMFVMILLMKCKLYFIILVVYTTNNSLIFECFCGYGLGCSFSALFCRVGGGIFTKGCDISCDFIGKVKIH
jgi:Na+/H+-translocating membrane pyrophosphatase